VDDEDREVRRHYETSDAGAYAVGGVCLDVRPDAKEYVGRLLLDKLTMAARHYPGGPVLDLCCATGQCLFVLAPTIERGVGLDFSSRYVEAASTRSAQLGLKNVAFVQGDAKAVPFKDGEFGMVYCFSALYAIPQVEIAIGEMSRVLRPGGMAILDFGNIRSLSAYCSKFYTEWARIYPITCRMIYRHLANSGLSVVERHCFQILPLWAGRPPWLKPLLHPGWKDVMSRRISGKMLDQWISSLPGLRSLAFRHVLVCRKI